MRGMLTAAWRVVAKRSVADWLILAAATVTILLATVLLAAGSIYVDAVTLGGLQRTLQDAPIEEANVEISVRSPPGVYAQNDALVVDEVLETFVATGGSIFRRALSDSYELPTQASDTVTDLIVFGYYDSIEDHASLVDGAWPERASRLEAAISAATADLLDLGRGDQVTVTNRRDRERTVRVTVTGIYSPDNPDHPYWYDDPLDVAGLAQAGSFRTFGPLVVDRQALLADLQPVAVDVDWRVFPDYDDLAINEVRQLSGSVAGLEERLNAATDARFDSFRVTSQIGRILTETDRSLLVTRSGVTVLSIQLTALAGYALFLTAGLLAESRTVEVHLLRSRGATTGQILTMAVMEGSILAIPAALVAPWLAVWLLSMLNTAGPLSSVALTIAPVATPGSFVLSALAAIGCIVALAVPAYRSARSRADVRAERSRQPGRTFAQRAGLDLALLLLAGIAFWQLRRYGSQITSSLDGRLGIDPLLVMAPALGLVAGAVLALRSIPTLARIADRIASVGTSTVAALAAWQVGRRPVRYARSALLLIIAISIGIFAASYTSTWTTSQTDQADFDTGSDVRSHRAASPITDLVAQAAYQRIDGVQIAMPVARQVSQLGRTLGNGAFIMLDAAVAESVVRIRDDLSPEPFSEVMRGLLENRPVLGALPLPGEPTGVAIDVAFELDPLPEDFAAPADIAVDRLAFAPAARLVLQDGNDLLHEVDLGPVPVDAGTVRLEGSLVPGLASDDSTPAYPLSVVDITFPSLMPFGIERTATLSVSGVWIEAGGWEPVPGFTEIEWQAATGRLSGRAIAPSIELMPSAGNGAVSVEIKSGVGRESLPVPITFSIRPAGTDLPPTLSVVVSEDFLESTGTAVGDQVRLSSLAARPLTGLVAAAVTEFPTVDPALAEPVIIDLPSLQMMTYEPGGDIRSADEWWLAVLEEDIAPVASALAAPPYESPGVEDRLTRARTLKSNPVALGTIGALSIGFVAAVVFAAMGFAVSS
ncbi:MAG: ABC transporter permease, partial [Acidimicrobiia bacterium]|nr:ABC transporter permease [Acidimicrobiia bacterium]